jgi:hypothetical protein
VAQNAAALRSLSVGARQHAPYPYALLCSFCCFTPQGFDKSPKTQQALWRPEIGKSVSHNLILFCDWMLLISSGGRTPLAKQAEPSHYRRSGMIS